jgi:hypothetical protein
LRNRPANTDIWPVIAQQKPGQWLTSRMHGWPVVANDKYGTFIAQSFGEVESAANQSFTAVFLQLFGRPKTRGHPRSKNDREHLLV